MFFLNYNGGPVIKLWKNDTIYDNINLMGDKKNYSYFNNQDFILNFEVKDYSSIVQLIDEKNNIEYISNPNIPIRENNNGNVFRTYDIISNNEVQKIKSLDMKDKENPSIKNGDELIVKKNKIFVSNVKSKDYNKDQIYDEKQKSNLIIKQKMNNDEIIDKDKYKNKNKHDWKRIDDLLDLINNK